MPTTWRPLTTTWVRLGRRVDISISWASGITDEHGRMGEGKGVKSGTAEMLFESDLEVGKAGAGQPFDGCQLLLDHNQDSQKQQQAARDPNSPTCL